MTALPSQMTAIEISSFGGPEVLQPTKRPLPTLTDGDILIKVAAAGINRPDVQQRKGAYAPPPGTTDLPGLEVAGEIVATLGDVGSWKRGDKVTALVAGGGYAEYAAAPALQCLTVPKGYDMVHAAALPETFFTVWTNVFQRGALKRDETFLVHGGSSGIGTTAIQLAHHFGARVITTVGNDEKAKSCRDLGADIALNYRKTDFVEAVMNATDQKGADLILDMVGGDYINRDLACLATDGRLIFIAFLQGPTAEVNFAKLMVKRQTISGSTLRPRSVAQKGEIAAALKTHVWPLLEAGKVKPVLYKTFPLVQAAEAHKLMESSTHTGKIVLTV